MLRLRGILRNEDMRPAGDCRMPREAALLQMDIQNVEDSEEVDGASQREYS